jgi:YidC/Oxa1 family membrane protein insertase
MPMRYSFVGSGVEGRMRNLGQRRGFMAEAFQVLVTIPDHIQAGMVGLHETTGLPWWATFACSTAVVRLGLLPLTRFQLLATRNLAKSMPEVNFLAQLLRERVKSEYSKRGTASNASELLSTIAVFRKGVKASFTLNDVSLKRIFALPMVNIACFATFVFSVRDLLAGATNAPPAVLTQLESGGTGWFVDLTVRDPTLALPVIALASSYCAIEIAFSRVGVSGADTKNMKLVTFFKDTIQTVLILSVPVVHTLPAGVFCYWIPSSIIGGLQSIALRTPLGQELLRIPPLPAPKGTSKSPM